MSDTPRTDAAWKARLIAVSEQRAGDEPTMLEFARQLERELASAREERDSAQSALYDATADDARVGRSRAEFDALDKAWRWASYVFDEIIVLGSDNQRAYEELRDAVHDAALAGVTSEERSPTFSRHSAERDEALASQRQEDAEPENPKPSGSKSASGAQCGAVPAHEPGSRDSTAHTARNVDTRAGLTADRESGASHSAPEGAGPDVEPGVQRPTDPPNNPPKAMKTLFAWTAPGGEYPSFLNVSEGDDGSGNPTICVTVRSPKGTGQATATTTIPATEFPALVEALQFHHLGLTEAARRLKQRESDVESAGRKQEPTT